jgi:hypothetical protein
MIRAPWKASRVSVGKWAKGVAPGALEEPDRECQEFCVIRAGKRLFPLSFSAYWLTRKLCQKTTIGLIRGVI